MLLLIGCSLIGCSDNARRLDHAACKLKALEVYKKKISDQEYEETRSYYVQTCMEAKGYTLLPRCGAAVNKWMLDDCYSRWLGRPRI